MTAETLNAAHLKMLREGSSISDAVIEARGPRTITDVQILKALGFASRQLRQPGLLLPLHTTDGSQPFSIYRPDTPRVEKKDGKEKPIKYEIPRGVSVRLDCPPTCRPMLTDPSIPLWLTEGQKKADSLASRGACAIALLGVWNFKGKNPLGGTTFLADWDYITLPRRDVRIVFDSDVMSKPEVRKALDRLTEHLQRKGAHVSAVYLPSENGKKCGVDDYLAAGHTLSDLEALSEGPRPQPHAAPATVRLLLHAPVVMRRPLLRHDNRTYTTIWPYVERTVSEIRKKDGTVVKLAPPNVTTCQQLMVVRDDGRNFGEGGDDPVDALGFTPHFPEIPCGEKLWSTAAVENYRAGVRPNPVDVFSRVAGVYSHYLDFSSSLVDYADMGALSACLSLMTWFTEAFDVLPYPWVNGDWGAGKTKWLTVWAQTSFLGQVMTWSGSFAALRDLADLGASLAFDDCENIDDPKADPEKRALVLAGNRRGAQVPLKEQNRDRTWKIRWVNAFCPRAFTAKKRPYGALETRALLIPLIRTDDAAKGNRDPVRLDGWPCRWRQLQDDLWATALMLLPEAHTIWIALDKETEAIGRAFEVWRAPIAVARLFEKHGVAGLEATIRKVMEATIQEKSEDPDNRTTKVVAAIGTLVFGSLDTLDTSIEVDVTSAEVAQKVKDLADPDENLEWATPTRIGLVLKSLRIPKKRDDTTPKRTRLKTITGTVALRLLRAYGLLPIRVSKASEASNPSNGPAGANSSTSESDAGLNGHGDAEADHVGQEDSPDSANSDDSAKSREQQPCRFCHKPDCRLTPGGQFCRLSEEDKQRWSKPGFFFADDTRDSWESEL